MIRYKEDVEVTSNGDRSGFFQWCALEYRRSFSQWCAPRVTWELIMRSTNNTKVSSNNRSIISTVRSESNTEVSSNRAL